METLEESSIELINQALKKIPPTGLKNMLLCWEYVYGYYLPRLYCEFYEKGTEKQMKPIKDYEYSFNHVKDRLKERYSINITKNQYIKLNDQVRKLRNPKKALFIDNGGDQEVYSWTWDKDKKVKVVWSNSKDRITTVLPISE